MELGESMSGKRAENQSYSTDKLKPNALAASQFQLAERPLLRSPKEEKGTPGCCGFLLNAGAGFSSTPPLPRKKVVRASLGSAILLLGRGK